MSCSSRCAGYDLRVNLDFDGNNHTISNLSETNSINAACAIGAVSNAGAASDSVNVGGLIGCRHEPDPDSES